MQRFSQNIMGMKEGNMATIATTYARPMLHYRNDLELDGRGIAEGVSGLKGFYGGIIHNSPKSSTLHPFLKAFPSHESVFNYFREFMEIPFSPHHSTHNIIH
jgi:hypothetical protein